MHSHNKARKRFFPHWGLSVLMLGLWLLMANSISLGQWLLGGFFAWGIPYLTQAFWPQKSPAHKPWVAVKLLLCVLLDIIIANMQVALLILGPSKKLQPAFITVPLALKDDFSITLLANTISLTPGTVTVDVNIEEAYLLVHSLHVKNMQTTINTIKTRYEAPLREIFAC